jgi:hypothetical protein
VKRRMKEKKEMKDKLRSLKFRFFATKKIQAGLMWG